MHAVGVMPYAKQYCAITYTPAVWFHTKPFGLYKKSRQTEVHPNRCWRDFFGGDKGIREERSDGIASQTIKGNRKFFFRARFIKGRCERQPAVYIMSPQVINHVLHIEIHNVDAGDTSCSRSEYIMSSLARYIMFAKRIHHARRVHHVGVSRYIMFCERGYSIIVVPPRAAAWCTPLRGAWCIFCSQGSKIHKNLLDSL